MTNSDRAVADLVNALDAIQRRAESALANTNALTNGAHRDSLAFISGVASQAVANVRRLQVRNADGYPVIQ